MTVSLVLLPGLDGTGELFAPLLEQLPRTIDPIVVGYPTHEPLEYSALVTHVLEKLPSGSPFVLLGESFSGPVAVLTASRKPAGLLGVILCASFASAPLRWPAALANFAPVHLAARLLGPQLLMGRFRTQQLVERLEHALAQVPGAVLRARLKAAARVDVTPELRSLNLPTLYLRASEDRLVPRSASELFAETAVRGKVEVIAGPHFLLQCEPANAARAIEAFAIASSAA